MIRLTAYRDGLIALLLWGAAVLPVPAAGEGVLLVLGDSLSAAYGMDPARGWVALLESRLAATGLPRRVVNASISGDTTRGGLSRLPAALERHGPGVVIVALGGNDGLRGVPVEETERNLAAMIEAARSTGARVVLVGIRLPPNYGPVYTGRFESLFARLAERYAVPLVPFLLEGVATHRDLMLEDGIHPRPEAQPRLLENVWRHLEPVLREGRGAPPPPGR